MSRYNTSGTALGHVQYVGAPAAASQTITATEQAEGECTLNRIKGAIEYGHNLLERLESLESRLNGIRPQAVPKDGPAVGYTQSLAGEMQRTADAAEHLTKRLEETISNLERFV